MSTALGGLGGLRVGQAMSAATRSTKLQRPFAVGRTSYRVHFDQKPHGNKWWNNRSHWQVNSWKPGVSGSNKSFRYYTFFNYHRKYLR